MTITAPAAGSYESQIYGYLENTLGFSPAGAAGALGNLQVESGFSPTAYNANEGAIGIGQWEGGRRAALQAYAAAHGGKETDLAMQLGYLGQELRNSYGSVLTYMRSATSPSAAAAEWDANYEVSAGTTRTQRVNDAQTISQQITMGQLTASASPAAGFKASPPPYPVGSLQPPLTAAQRSAVLAYTKTQLAHYGPAQGVNFGSLSDAELLAYYAIAVSQGSGTASPGQIISDIASGAFGWVAPLVYKAGFAIGGLALIVVGANAAAKKG
jgi:hypothetical protein